MLVRFADLGRVLGIAQGELNLRGIHEFWRLVLEAQLVAASRVLSIVDRRVELAVAQNAEDGPQRAHVALVATELAAVPIAEAIAQLAPATISAEVGRVPQSHAASLVLVHSETGIDLSTSRLRVGFTRGHLLEVVVLVPAEVEAGSSDLQVACELYLETAVGDRALDCWVGNILVDRTTRSSSLLVLQNKPQGTSYPLSEAASLIQVGISGLTLELPHTLLGGSSGSHLLWTALEIPESGPAPQGSPAQSLQADRRYASTCFPEALKSALEGAPFSSCRFTRGAEVFCYLSWGASGKGAAARGRLRLIAEDLLRSGQLQTSASLAGSGFGKDRDYLDVWIVPETLILERLVRAVGAVVGPVRLGFYDTIWSEEQLVFAPLKSP